MDQLERQYERSQQDSLSRLRMTEDNYTRNVESLKAQQSSLKHQINLNADSHSQELKRVHDKYRVELDTTTGHKDA